MTNKFLLIFINVSALYLLGCSNSNDLTARTFRQVRAPATAPNPVSPSGETVFRISSGLVSSASTDNSTIKANVTPMKKQKYVSGNLSAEYAINAKRMDK